MRVKTVTYLQDYKLKILFSNNKVKVVDLKKWLKEHSGIFSPLQNIEYFQRVTIDDCQLSICWPNGADICPNILYDMGKEVRQIKSIVKPPTRKQLSSSISRRAKTRIASKIS